MDASTTTEIATIVATALATGAVEGMKKAASNEVESLWQKLHDRVRRVLSPSGVAKFDATLKAAEPNETVLATVIEVAAEPIDEETVKLARQLLQTLTPAVQNSGNIENCHADGAIAPNFGHGSTVTIRESQITDAAKKKHGI